MKPFLIYGLVDPTTGQLRYVGKSTSRLRRPARHSAPSELKKDNTHKGRWLKTLSQKPAVVVIQELDDTEILSEAERFWIQYFRQLGMPLTNLTDGGEGTKGLIRGKGSRPDLSALNVARRGIPLSTSHKSHVSKALKAIGHCPPKNTKRRIFSAEEKLTLSQKWSKPVECSNGQSFSSTVEAGRQLGLWPQNIAAVARGRLKTTGGLSFWYNLPSNLGLDNGR